jgi:hypothetical protein
MSKYKISSTTIIGPIICWNEDIVVNDKESNFEVYVIVGLNVKIQEEMMDLDMTPNSMLHKRKK